MAENKDDQGEKLRINLYPTREGSNCRITNFMDAKNTYLRDLHEQILKRRGVPFKDTGMQKSVLKKPVFGLIVILSAVLNR